MNPLLPPHIHIPDAEARQWKDGRLYLYGSLDTGGDGFYCSDRYMVFSSADLKEWKNHGISFDARACHTADHSWLFAPDCIYKDGKYYLLYCCSDKSEGIAVSDHPAGPFRDARPVLPADKDAIDPAALVDDDGQVYYFWGQFNLHGARMNADMQTLDESTLQPDLLNETADGFHEGSCIRKRNGIYYMVYADISRGRPTCLGYATGTSPLGPYEKRGIIIDNTGCDPETWNNHGSIAEFNGQWYVFYHRSSQGSLYNRRVCAEPITFNDDGTIDEVEMTTQGTEGPLPAGKPVAAWRACLLSGGVRTEGVYPRTSDETYTEHLSWIRHGDRAAFKYLDFGTGVTGFEAEIAAPFARGKMEVRIDRPDGLVLCIIPGEDTGGWQRWKTVRTEVTAPVTGIHALYLVWEGGAWTEGRLFDIKGFVFS